MENGFAFIINHIIIEGKLPIEILDGYTFRPASDSEIIEINKFLSKTQFSAYGQSWPPYDRAILENSEAGSFTIPDEILPRSMWKYWVVSYEGNGNAMIEIEKAFMLINPSLDVGFRLLFHSNHSSVSSVGAMYNAEKLAARSSKADNRWEIPKTISTKELEKTKHITNLIINLTEDHSFIRESINSLESFKAISGNPPASTLAHFSIIEALITHKPRSAETLDSITHQIKNKMKLLRNMYKRKIHICSYFENISEINTWKKLYEYRSVIAHGDKANFKKEFKSLKDPKIVNTFLIENIKELILLALDDPEFIADLREC